jgi:Domain of unknown function (DUF4160)
MPQVFEIDSIQIDVYSNEHPPPHFHAIYAEHEVLVEIRTVEIYAGYLPTKQLRKVLSWVKDDEVQKYLLEIFYTLNPKLRR